jgi:hypothetical protein
MICCRVAVVALIISALASVYSDTSKARPISPCPADDWLARIAFPVRQVIQALGCLIETRQPRHLVPPALGHDNSHHPESTKIRVLVFQP